MGSDSWLQILTRASCHVTYNFDPERWLENERLRLEQRRRTGELSEEAAARAR